MRLAILENKLEKVISDYSPYSNVVGLARSIMALGTLLTLLTNDSSIFMPVGTNGIFINPLLQNTNIMSKLNFFLMFGVSELFVTKTLAIIILLVVISGYYPQLSSLLHWWINISFIYFSSAVDGGDHMAAILSLLLIPLCISDPRKNHWFKKISRKGPLNILGILSVFLIRMQVAIIYLHASTGKFINNEWIDGTAVYYWFNHSIFGMSAWLSYLLNPLLASGLGVTTITYAVLILELLLFTAIGMPFQRRKWIFPLAIAFHAGIILVHGIFSFFFSISACLILYLLDSRKEISFKWRILPLLTGCKHASGQDTVNNAF
jgi:antimicrobial peptide system SdpB family protein